MKIRVEDIPKEGMHLNFRWGQESIEPFLTPNDPYQMQIQEPLEVAVFIKKIGDYIHVTGELHGELVVPCHRCLEAFIFPMNASIETFLYPPRYLGSSKEEVELDEEDMEQEFFDGEEIDLDVIVAEEIFLNFPPVLLCSPHCKGLCPKCGSNLNTSPCNCKREGDSPFAVLARWKTK